MTPGTSVLFPNIHTTPAERRLTFDSFKVHQASIHYTDDPPWNWVSNPRPFSSESECVLRDHGHFHSITNKQRFKEGKKNVIKVIQ
ncbi:hypothetical protein AVEN_26771-1 [Araneus ventricosus]|uniref:Uncharacterized protein n=1 Tax=Araneus ventricosus TaxID=182803 RepID=A0A4Y2D7A2_ARAVE|nr:hypothetical protein AVEN_26771-1 [Araneus ventricosus]